MGECNKCMENLHICKASCCKVLPFTIKGYLSERMRDYYEKHGCTIKRLGRDSFQVLVPMRCPQLTEDNLCKLHGTIDKPYFCNLVNEDSKNDPRIYLTEGCIYGNNN